MLDGDKGVKVQQKLCSVEKRKKTVINISIEDFDQSNNFTYYWPWLFRSHISLLFEPFDKFEQLHSC